jgi:hypothetical protein
MTVNPVLAPSVTVTSNPGSAICKNTPVLFSAMPAYGGAGATYTWYKGVTPVGTGITYNDATLVNGDKISVKMHSNYACRTTDSVISTQTTMSVTDPATPVVSISANPGSNVHIGQVVTFSATVTSAGSAPAYQWNVNGYNIAGATSTTFTQGNFTDGDVVGLTVTNNSACGVETGTGTVALSVYNNLGVKEIKSNSSFAVAPNPSKGTFILKGATTNVTDEEVSVEVTNMLGQVIYRNSFLTQGGKLNQQIQLGSVANGMYILNLHSGADQASFHIVVEQ